MGVRDILGVMENSRFDYNDNGKTLCNSLLCTLNEWILWHVNYTSVNLL